MKKIHLIRHAKSSWKDTTLADIDRPLNKRGFTTSNFMADPILKAGCSFTNIFCSPALRAKTTIERISSHLPHANITWKIDDRLYTFDDGDLFVWFRSLEESINEVTIIGHNPALTDFTNRISHSDIENTPTCGYVQLKSHHAILWKDVTEASFQLSCFLVPKQLMNRSER